MAPAAAQTGAAHAPPEAVTTASAPSLAAARPTEAGNVDMFKLATEIATPFKEKSAAGPGPERKPAAAPAPRAAGKQKYAAEASAARAPEAGAPAATRIDKRAHVQTQAERSESAFRQATALLNQGRVAEAIDGYKSALQYDPAHAPARQALVGLLLENRRIDEAREFLQDGLRLNPGQSSYAMLLARIQVERGDLQGAHELLRRHAGSVAADADYYAFDAAVLQRLGRHKEAVAGYEQALQLAPRAGLWWMGMGISLQADNRGAEALDAYRRAKSAGGLSPPLLSFVDQRMKQLQ
ncbi:MAG: tetratricopeptide repeat protein [Burkholderiales bacterium]|nr:tetratricopeptide repeat protein [Burkholderiales bacterium]